jgi:hypothetical protein
MVAVKITISSYSGHAPSTVTGKTSLKPTVPVHIKY